MLAEQQLDDVCKSCSGAGCEICHNTGSSKVKSLNFARNQAKDRVKNPIIVTSDVDSGESSIYAFVIPFDGQVSNLDDEGNVLVAEFNKLFGRNTIMGHKKNAASIDIVGELIDSDVDYDPYAIPEIDRDALRHVIKKNGSTHIFDLEYELDTSGADRVLISAGEI